MGSNLAQNWQLSAPIMGALVLFGIAYALLVHNLGARKDGYTWLLVVIGDAVTVLAGFPINATPLDILILFACSGAPMALGNILEHVVKRERDAANRTRAIERIIEEIADD